MKNLFLFFMVLLMVSCNVESTDTPQETIITANAKGSGGGPPCGQGQQLPCPPAKHFNWATMDTIRFLEPEVGLGSDNLNVIILSDGFTLAEKPIWDTAVIEATDAILFTTSTSVYGINIYANWIPSSVSGIPAAPTANIPIVPVGYNNTLRTFSNRMGMSYYFGIDWNTRFKLQQDLIGNGQVYWDNNENRSTSGGYFEKLDKSNNAGLNSFVVIIVNSPLYGGGADYLDVPGATAAPVYPGTTASQLTYGNFSVAIIPLDTNHNGLYFKDLVEHEIGHSIWDMDDEYEDNYYLTNSPIYEPEFYNHPIRANTKTSNPGTWVRGSRYYADNTGPYFRSTTTSKMLEVLAPWSPVQEAIIQARIISERTNNGN